MKFSITPSLAQSAQQNKKKRTGIARLDGWSLGRNLTQYSVTPGFHPRFSEDIARQIFVLQDRREPLADVARIDGDFPAMHLGRRKRDLVQQALENSMQPARADIFRALVDVGRDQRDFLDRVFGESKMNAFGFQQGFILLDQRILRFGQNPHEIRFTKGTELDPNRETPLKLRNQVRGLGGVKSARGNEQNVISFHHAVFRVDSRTFDDRQKIPLYALARNIGAVHGFSPSDLVDLVQEDNPGLLHPADRFGGDFVHIDQLAGFLLREDLQRLGYFHRLFF